MYLCEIPRPRRLHNMRLEVALISLFSRRWLITPHALTWEALINNFNCSNMAKASYRHQSVVNQSSPISVQKEKKLSLLNRAAITSFFIYYVVLFVLLSIIRLINIFRITFPQEHYSGDPDHILKNMVIIAQPSMRVCKPLQR